MALRPSAHARGAGGRHPRLRLGFRPGAVRRRLSPGTVATRIGSISPWMPLTRRPAATGISVVSATPASTSSVASSLGSSGTSSSPTKPALSQGCSALDPDACPAGRRLRARFARTRAGRPAFASISRFALRTRRLAGRRWAQFAAQAGAAAIAEVRACAIGGAAVRAKDRRHRVLATPFPPASADRLRARRSRCRAARRARRP